MTEYLFIYILIVHFLADFALQTHEQATNKYKGGIELLYHVGVYSLIWLGASFIFIQDWPKAIIFSAITFVAHFLTDLITSNTSKKFFDKKDMHNGFVVVGFDQMLHYIQLYYTFKLLM